MVKKENLNFSARLEFVIIPLSSLGNVIVIVFCNIL